MTELNPCTHRAWLCFYERTADHQVQAHCQRCGQERIGGPRKWSLSEPWAILEMTDDKE